MSRDWKRTYQEWSVWLLILALLLLGTIRALSSDLPPAPQLALVLILAVLFPGCLAAWRHRPSSGQRLACWLTLLLLLPILTHVIIQIHLHSVGGSWHEHSLSQGRKNADRVRKEFNRFLEETEALAQRASANSVLRASLEDPNVENRAVIFGILSELYSQDKGHYGLEILDESGQSVAWAGTVFPRHKGQSLGAATTGAQVTVIPDQMYTLLWLQQAWHDTLTSRPQGSVNLYRPLAANTPIRAEPLPRGVFLSDVSAKIHSPLRIDFLYSYPYSSPGDKPTSSSTDELSVTLPDRHNSTLGVARFSPPSYADYCSTLHQMQTRITILVIGCVLILLSGLALRRLHQHGLAPSQQQPTPGHSRAIACVLMTMVLWTLRLWLLVLGFPDKIVASSVFDSAQYSAPSFLGLSRSPGDLFISLIFLIVNMLIIWRTVASVSSSALRTPRIKALFPLAVLATALVIHLLFNTYAAGLKSLVHDSTFSYFGYFKAFSSAPYAVTVMNIFLWGVALYCAAYALLILFTMAVGPGWPAIASRIFWLFSAYAITGAVWILGTGQATYLTERITFMVTLLLVAAAMKRRTGETEARRLTLALLVTLASCLVSFPLFQKEVFREEDRLIQNRVSDVLESAPDQMRAMVHEALGYFRSDSRIREALAKEDSTSLDNLAFVEWINSPLARFSVPSQITVVDETGSTVSQFNYGVPAEFEKLTLTREQEIGQSDGTWLAATRARLQGEEHEFYSGAVPVMADEKLLGAVMLTVSARTSPVARLEKSGPTVLQPFSPPDTFLHKYSPNRLVVSLFERETLIESTDPALLKGYRPSAEVLEAIFEQKIKNLRVEEKIAGKNIVHFYFPRKSADRIIGMVSVGYEKIGTWTAVHDFLRFTFTNMLIALSALIIVHIVQSLFRKEKERSFSIRRFQDRLLLSFVLLIIIPMVFMAYFGRNLILAQQENKLRSEIEEDLVMARLLLEKETQAAVNELATRPDMVRAMKQATDRPPEVAPPGAATIHVYDPDGNALWAQDGEKAHSEIFSRVRLTLLPHLFYTGSNPLSIGAMAPVFDEQADTMCLGFIEYSYPLDDQLCRSIGQLMGRDLHVYSKGIISASSQPELFHSGIFSQKLPSDAFLNIELLGTSTFHTKRIIGKVPHAEGYHPLFDGLGRIAAVLSIPIPFIEDSLGQQTARAVSVILVVYGLILSLTLMVSVILSRRISAPVRELTEGTRRIAAGQLDVAIGSHAQDEIGDLVASFNKMTRDLKSSQERLVQAEKDAAWREMAKQVAHEVKNPLTPIKLSIQHLNQAYQDRAENFEQILAETTLMVSEQIDVLKNIASEFSAFARLPRRELKACQINEILQSSLKVFAGSLEPVALVTEYGERLPLIDIDPEEMQRVFVNIIQNAIQAMPDGGTLHVKSEIHKAHVRGQIVETIVVRITDTGYGISEEQQGRLFQPSFSTKTGGAGLGLAISKKVIDDLGGDIRIRSKVGEGTEVSIALPVRTERPQSP